MQQERFVPTNNNMIPFQIINKQQKIRLGNITYLKPNNLKELKKYLEINPIAGKDYMSLQSLPIKEKDKIKQHYEKFFTDSNTQHLQDVAWQSIIDPMYKEQLDPHLNSGFKQYNILLDKYRKTNFVDTYPEYEEWWNSIKF